MALVGVVIPAFNPEPGHLRRALESLQAQTMGDWACVVVDDGSDPPVSPSLIAGESRMTLRRQENRGVAAARNAGAGAVAGDFVAFLDQDDEWLPTKLERQLSFMSAHGLAMSDTSFEFVRDGRVERDPFVHHNGEFLRLLRSARIGLSTLMMRRRDFFGMGGFDEGLAFVADWDLELRAADAGIRFDRVDEVLSLLHLHGANASVDYRTMYREETAVLRRYRADPRQDVRVAAAQGMAHTRKLHTHHALGVFGEKRSVRDLVWAGRCDPGLVTRLALRKLIRSSASG